MDLQYNKFQGLRYNEKSNVFEKLKGGTPPACRKNGKPDWPECRKACERKPIEPNSPSGCTSQIKVKLVRCSSCCCKSGVATQDITHSLLYGEQKVPQAPMPLRTIPFVHQLTCLYQPQDCGIWFAAQDAIVRAVVQSPPSHTSLPSLSLSPTEGDVLAWWDDCYVLQEMLQRLDSLIQGYS